MYGLNLNPSDPPALSDSPAGVTVIGGENIASWGRRLAAYALDLLVLITLTMILADAGHPVPAGTLVGAMIITAYMIVAQLTTGFTLGKYILGIQVVRDYDPSAAPSIGRIVIRETARLIVGIGIFFRLGDARRQGWHDLLGDTVVVDRPVKTAVRLSLMAALAVSFIAAVTVGGRENSQTAQLKRAVTAETAEIQKLQAEIDRLRAARGTVSEIQKAQQQVLPLLDRFEASVRRLKDLTQTLADQAPANQAKALAGVQSLYSTLLEIAAVERQQANLILSVAPGGSLDSVRAGLMPLANQLVQLQSALARESQAVRTSRGR